MKSVQDFCLDNRISIRFPKKTNNSNSCGSVQSYVLLLSIRVTGLAEALTICMTHLSSILYHNTLIISEFAKDFGGHWTLSFLSFGDENIKTTKCQCILRFMSCPYTFQSLVFYYFSFVRYWERRRNLPSTFDFIYLRNKSY